MGLRCATALLAALGWASPATAASVDWQLSNLDGTVLGTFTLDFAPPALRNPLIYGFADTYDIPSFTFLGSGDTIAGQAVEDYLLIFSSVTGQVFTTEYGSGEGQSVRVNESAIRIGTLGNALSPAGGIFPVVIEEVYNYDQTYFYCLQYEEFYDEETGETRIGNCLQGGSDTSFNLDSGDWYYGLLTSVGPIDGVVPVPPGIALLAGGLASLGLLRRQPVTPG